MQANWVVNRILPLVGSLESSPIRFLALVGCFGNSKAERPKCAGCAWQPAASDREM